MYDNVIINVIEIKNILICIEKKEGMLKITIVYLMIVYLMHFLIGIMNYVYNIRTELSSVNNFRKLQRTCCQRL